MQTMAVVASSAVARAHGWMIEKSVVTISQARAVGSSSEMPSALVMPRTRRRSMRGSMGSLREDTEREQFALAERWG